MNNQSYQTQGKREVYIREHNKALSKLNLLPQQNISALYSRFVTSLWTDTGKANPRLRPKSKPPYHTNSR